LVPREIGWDVINVDKDAWVGGTISTWERYKGSGSSSSTIDNVDLSASEIELSTLGGGCDMQTDLLSSQQVLTAGSILWDRESELSLSLRWES